MARACVVDAPAMAKEAVAAAERERNCRRCTGQGSHEPVLVHQRVAVGVSRRLTGEASAGEQVLQGRAAREPTLIAQDHETVSGVTSYFEIVGVAHRADQILGKHDCSPSVAVGQSRQR